MKLKIETILPYLLVNLLFGTFIFLYGFFPLSFTSDQRAEYKDLPMFIDDVPLNHSHYEPQVSRMILMVIDALRSDFIQNSNNASMKYINKLLQENKACNFNVQVASPTVTMPRIKAMTSGTIPNFIDVVLNLGSSELKIDSMLHQAYDKGAKMVFCGDNTWVKMFPEMFYRKLENEDSLFVNDFYEGDKNITQKLVVELKRSDWKLLILHFLGLDHIGHVEGPTSSKVPSKLKEMDTTIMHISLAMQEWKKSEALPPILIVTGDHGMRDTGGHGGSSPAEINVPLIITGTECVQQGDFYNQVDIAPTLSVLLGLPIPASSIGTLISGVLDQLPRSSQLYAMHYNAKRLLHKLTDIDGSETIEDKEFYIQYMEALQEHKVFLDVDQQENTAAYKRAKLLYASASTEMSLKLSKLFVKYDEISITIGLACLTLALCCILLTLVSSAKFVNIASKYIFFISISLGAVRQFVCRSTELDTGFCSTSNTYLVSAIFALMLFGFISCVQVLRSLLLEVQVSKIYACIISLPNICWYLLFGICFQIASLSSSSFIEEEHQTWFYLLTSLLIAFYYLSWREMLSVSKPNENEKEPTKSTIPQGPTLMNFLSGKDALNRFAWFQISWLCLLAMHLFARRLNQTGDKWLSVPDIGDWLVMDEHRLWNSFFVFGSLCLMIINCVDYGSILTNVLTLTAAVLIYYFRTLNGSVYFAGIKKSDSTKTCLVLFWLNIIEIFAINFVPVLYKLWSGKARKMDVKICLGTIVIIFSLVSALIHKPHNIFLNALLLSTSSTLTVSINAIFKQCTELTRLFIQCTVYYWLGKCFFFYQGNSNSLASIDLNAGYVGLTHFHFATVALLLTINTFNGPILAFLALIHKMLDASEEPSTSAGREAELPNEKTSNIPRILIISSILVGLPFAIFCFVAVLFRNHIFVWTVFSPKLLYEVYHLVLMVLLWCSAIIVM